MINYEYRCKKCEALQDEMHPCGKAPETTKCKECGGKSKRVYSYQGFILKGPGDHWPSQQIRRKNQMTRNNDAAGERMRKTECPIKLASQ